MSFTNTRSSKEYDVLIIANKSKSSEVIYHISIYIRLKIEIIQFKCFSGRKTCHFYLIFNRTIYFSFCFPFKNKIRFGYVTGYPFTS